MTVKIDRYEIQKEIGRGAAGIVYQAYDPSLGRVVAVKILRTDILDPYERQDFTERFRREAQTAGKLSHPNIVTIHDLGEANNILYIIMELITGTTLKELIDESRQFNVKRVMDILSQVAGGLDYAHKNGIVHRDIKPANIIIDSKNVAKITDFGIAKIPGTDSTQVGRVLGTPFYMSPEQFTGKRVSHKSDLFSFGIMAYMLLFGRKPFDGETLHRVAYQIIYENPVFPADNMFSHNRLLVGVINKIMAKDPAERYETASEFVSQLRSALFRDSEDYEQKIIDIAKLECISDDMPLEETEAGSRQVESIPDVSAGFRPDDIIAHYYKIINEIGASTVATVYFAENINLGRNFVVKKIHPSLMFDRDFIEIFKREIKAQARLSHYNIAQIVHFDPQTLSVIQEYVDGETIFQILEKKGSLKGREALPIIRGILKGLEYAHDHGMVHREIKPSNIMVDRNGVTKITDFGIALIKIEDRKNQAGIGLGIPEYMSPEQIRGDRNIDSRTDIYSLGILMYEMLAGRVPFARDQIKNISDFAIMEMQSCMPPKPLAEIKSGIDRKLSDIVMKALEKDPDKRFQSCDEFLRALDNIRIS